MRIYGNRKTLISAAALLGIVLAIYYPIAVNAGNSINGSLDDVYAILWQLWWFKYSLIDLHANPSFSPFVESPFGVAVTHATIIDHLIALPFTWAWGAVASYNIMILFSFFFSALGMYLLVFELTGSLLASFFSGAAYAFSPFHTVFSASGGMDAAQIQYMPFTLLFLIRSDKYRSRSDFYLFILSLLLCVLSFGYYAALTALMLAIYFVYRKALPFLTITFFKNGYAGPVKAAAYFSLVYIAFVFAYNAFEEIAPVIGSALLLSVPVAGLIAAKRFEGDVSEIKRIALAITPNQKKLFLTVFVLFTFAVLFFLFPVFGSASRSISSSYLVPAYSYFVPPVDHQLLGRLIPSWLIPAPDPFVGRMVYTGLILPVLSIISILKSVPDEEKRGNRNFFILLFIIGVLLALPPVVKIGEFSLYGPIYFFHKLIPPFVDVRRVVVIILISLCVLAGFGLTRIFSMFRSKIIKALILVFSFILVSIEFYPNVNVKNMSFPAAYMWLANEPGDFSVIEYPLTSIYDVKRYEGFYGQTVHGKRLVNPFGALGHEPSASKNGLKPFIERGGPANDIFVNTENASGALSFLGVKYAVVRTDKLGYVPIIDEKKGFKEAARFSDSVVYEIDAKPAKAYISLSGFLKGSYFRNYSQKTEDGFEIRNPYVRAKDISFQGKDWTWMEKEGAIKITNLNSEEADYTLTFLARSLVEKARLKIMTEKETYEFEVSTGPKEIAIKGIRLGPSGALVLRLISDERSARFGKDLLDQGNNDSGGALVTIGISDARLTESAPEATVRSKNPEMTEGLFGEDI